MALQRTLIGIFATAVLGIAMVLAMVMLRTTPQQLLGRLLEGDELLLIQRQSDWDGDFDIDFLDFTVFAAFYEET